MPVAWSEARRIAHTGCRRCDWSDRRSAFALLPPTDEQLFHAVGGKRWNWERFEQGALRPQSLYRNDGVAAPQVRVESLAASMTALDHRLQESKSCGS